MTTGAAEMAACPMCGNQFTVRAAGAGRAARYCSQACRQDAYRRRHALDPNELRRLVDAQLAQGGALRAAAGRLDPAALADLHRRLAELLTPFAEVRPAPVQAVPVHDQPANIVTRMPVTFSLTDVDAPAVVDDAVQVGGVGPVATTLSLMTWRDGDWSARFVAVATPRDGGSWDPITGIESGSADESAGGYGAPCLAPGEAEAAAAHLDALAALADAGVAPTPPTRYGRAAARLGHLIDQDPDSAGAGLPIDDQFPLTGGELLALLRDHDDAGMPGSAGSTRRSVVAAAAAAAGGETGVVWLDLARDDAGAVRIAVTGIEGDAGDPDDEHWRPYTAHHTPAGARALAAELRALARSART